jgi:hypothetical protein
MNEPDKNKILLEELIRKREEETDAFRKLLRAIQDQQKTVLSGTPAGNEESTDHSVMDNDSENSEV